MRKGTLMICMNCGANVENGSLYCNVCGAPMGGVDPRTTDLNPAGAAQKPSNPSIGSYQAAAGQTSQANPAQGPYGPVYGSSGQAYGAGPQPLQTNAYTSPYTYPQNAQPAYPYGQPAYNVPQAPYPAKKSKAPLIIGITAGILVLFGLILGAAYMVFHSLTSNGPEAAPAIVSPTEEGSEATPDVEEEAADPAEAFYGTWDLVSIESSSEALNFGTDDLDFLEQMGLHAFVNLYDDGTAVLSMYGENLGATWQLVDDAHISLVFDDDPYHEEAVVELQGDTIIVTNESLLDGSLTFQKGEPKDPSDYEIDWEDELSGLLGEDFGGMLETDDSGTMVA